MTSVNFLTLCLCLVITSISRGATTPRGHVTPRSTLDKMMESSPSPSPPFSPSSKVFKSLMSTPVLASSTSFSLSPTNTSTSSSPSSSSFPSYHISSSIPSSSSSPSSIPPPPCPPPPTCHDEVIMDSREISNEQKLMHRLLQGYDSSVRPVFDAADAVDVNLGLTLTQILDLDEKNQVLTTNVWLEASWYDERLNWTVSEFGGITSIRIPCQRVWLPDIVLYNSVDDYTSGYMPSLAMVYNDSRVFWGPVIRFRSSCKIDITFFPFDTQICKLKMGSWAYTGLQVNVWNSSATMDLSNFVDNGEWELLDVAVIRHVVHYNCCPEPFPDVTFTMQLRRRTKYYFMNIIIPCIILSFLCLGGFLLPPESGEKITLGLSVLLTITVFMLMVADKMPQTSESISVISIYLMVVLATSCLSVLSSVLVLSIHHQRGKPSRPPLWLRRLCFIILAPLLCLRRHRKLPKRHDNNHVTRHGKESRLFKSGGKISNCEDECEVLRLDSRGVLPRADHPSPAYCETEEVEKIKASSVVQHLVGLLHSKQNVELRDEEVFAEWHDVAFVLDRSLFAFFFFLTLVSTVCILGMRPSLTKL